MLAKAPISCFNSKPSFENSKVLFKDLCAASHSNDWQEVHHPRESPMSWERLGLPFWWCYYSSNSLGPRHFSHRKPCHRLWQWRSHFDFKDRAQCRGSQSAARPCAQRWPISDSFLNLKGYRDSVSKEMTFSCNRTVYYSCHVMS